jgi:L-iditol 2-dehydrogenase
MNAAVYRGPGDVRFEQVEQPQAGPGEMVVRVEACGVCGTDIKKVQKGLLPGPRIFGHEMAGTVAAVGRGVSRFREGDRVALHHHIPCLECFYCDRAAYAQCEGYKRNGTTAGFEPAGGGFAEYVKALDWIVERGAIPVPDGVDAEEASFVEPVNTCLKAVRRAALQPGESVLVVGQGPIGLLLTQLCRWSGCAPIVTDPLPDRREMALRLGASVALPAGEGVPAEVRRLTGRGVDVALVAALGTAALRQAIDAVRPAGRIIVFAATSPGEMAEVDLGALCAAEKELLTSYSASVDVQDLAARLVFGREVRVRDLITHRFPLEQAARALDLAARPAPGVLKVMLRPDARREGAPDGSR